MSAPSKSGEGETRGGQGTGERGLLALAIRRPVGVSMIVLAMLVFGLVGYQKLQTTLLPELSYPTVTIRTEYEGASPEDVEDRISEPIREAVSVLGSVSKVTSISRPGRSDVIIEFAWGTPMMNATGDLREKLDRAFLPGDAEKPLILRYDPSLDPMMVIGLSGEGDPMEMRYLAEEEIADSIGELDGVAAVKVKGGDEKEILVALDETNLTSLGLDIRQIASQIGAENLNSSAGKLEEADTQYLVRALNEYRSLDELRDVIVARRNNANIRLRDVARVFATTPEREVITRVDGKPVVLIEIFKEADANLVALASSLRDRIFGTDEQRGFVAKNGLVDEPPSETPSAKQSGESASSAAKAPEGAKTAKDANNASKSKKGASRGGWGGDKMRKWREQQRKKRMRNYLAAQVQRSSDFELSLLSDPSRYIENSIVEVLESAVVGGLLAVLVLFLFLQQVRPTLLISIAIPLSLVVTFAPLYLSDVTLNVMSLGGLALGVGMLVDTSIVVLESITRCREEGDSLRAAAFRGVAEVSSAVVASTLTTVAVFLPIVFVQGIAGQLFRDQALAVVFSLLVSLLVSLFLLPMLASRGAETAAASAGDREEAPGVIARAFAATLRVARRGFSLVAKGILWLAQWPSRLFALCYAPIEAAYPRVLAAALRVRVVVVLLAFAAFGFALTRLPTLGSEVLPEVHQGEFQVLAFLSRDVDVERSDEVVTPIENKIRAIDGVKRTFATIGVDPEELRGSEEGQHSSRIHVVLETSTDMEALEERVRSDIRDVLAREPAILSTRFQSPTLFTIATPVSVEIYGHDLRDLRKVTEDVGSLLGTLPEVRDVRATLARGNTEVVVRFDRERLAQLGIEVAEASRRLAAMVQGETPTRFPEREKKVDIRVRLDPDQLLGVRKLEQIDLRNSGASAPIPLGSVAKLELLEGPSEIRRLGGRRAAEVQGAVAGLDVGSVQDRIAAEIADMELPEGVEITLGGQREEMERSRASIIQALLLAVFLVYVVMAAQFESLLQPLIILCTVPLALTGVVLALELLGIPVSVVVFLGAIMLAGIVVNNAIVLIDRINQERARGKDLRSAVLDGSCVRLRPVLMTTTTTVLGLIPLTGWIALRLFGGSGEGVELRAPMAITVIAGLLFATVLTLIVIPCVYSLVTRARRVPSASHESTPPSGITGEPDAGSLHGA